mmetsp:Transcript_2106/g.2768  ORF Transcript_2106/g.2768 Transcript_2106/m.2768 type:complete len:93 (+) Transcript_2106:409-687(+)
MERVYDETEDNNLKPTAACYHGVITGITLCKDLFQKCCREGQLTNTSLRIAMETLPDSSIEKLILEEGKGSDKRSTNIRNLPPQWSENIRGR